MIKQLFVIGGILLLNFFSSINISQKKFFNDYFSNTTQIDLYEKSASIYLNNSTFSKYQITLRNSSDFQDNLEQNNYSQELFYKYSSNISSSFIFNSLLKIEEEVKKII